MTTVSKSVKERDKSGSSSDLNFLGEKLEIFILFLTSAVLVVNVSKLNETNDVGALRLIVCSKYQEDKRQVLTPNHQVAGWNMNNVLFAK